MKKEIKVLLLEDDPNLGSITLDYLKAKGFSCRWEINGELGYRCPTIQGRCTLGHLTRSVIYLVVEDQA